MRIGCCYVCKKPLNKKETIIKVTNTLWRHEDCKTGSYNWMKSDRAKKSEFKSLYTGEKND